ncbi:MAG: hypothetical protein OEZ59_03905, partial [Deltaproteobacteria bacterium]|nr:hypothetical protein [Deltaproteobacteria bacterium]
MFFRSIISSVVCALVLMGWGYFYWVVIHPPGGGMLPLPREEGLSMFFLETIPSSGVYVFPSIKGESPKDDGHDMEDYQARHSLGPTGILMFSREGSDPYSYEKLLRGFLQ